MGPIHWSSYSVSGGTEGVEFIRRVDVRELQMHEIWCLGSDGITCEVQATARIDVCAETVGQFATKYITENGRRIPIIGQISINGSVKLLGIPDYVWVCGLLFLENVLDTNIPHVCGDKNYLQP